MVKAHNLTDVEKIRRLPWLVAASLTNNIFCVLTFTGAVFILFLRELGFDKTHIGFLLSLVPFSQIIALFVASLLARLGIKKSFLIFFGLRKLIFAFILPTPLILSRFGLHVAFIWVALCLLLFSLVRAVEETAIFNWYQEIVPDKIRGKFSAVNTIIATIGIMAVVTAAGFVIDHFAGWARFTSLIAVGIVIGLISVFCYAQVPGGAPNRDNSISRTHFNDLALTLHDRNFLCFMAGLGLAFLGLTSLFAFVPLYMKEKVGLADGQVVWLDVAGYFGAIITCYLWGWSADRYGSKPVMLSNLALASALPFFWFLMPRHHPSSNYLALTIAFIGGAANTGWLVAYSRYLFVTAVPPLKKIPYMALFFAWAGLVSGAGPLISGWFIDLFSGVNVHAYIFTFDNFSPFFALHLIILAAAFYVLAHIKRDGSVSTPTFWTMLLQGHTLMAFSYLLRHRWARDEPDRIITTERLGHTKTLLGANELIEAIHDPSFNVRYEAIIAIAHLPHHPHLVEELILVLGGNQPDLSIAAAWSLGKIGDKTAIYALRETLLSEYPLLQASSARALGTLQDQQSIPYLLKKLKTESDPSLRLAYASALGALRARDALDGILMLLYSTQDNSWREELSLAVARIVSTEPHYIRLRRRLLVDFETQAAQTILNFKRALTFDHPDIIHLKILADRASDAFAQGDHPRALLHLKEFALKLPHEKLDPPMVTVLRECLKRIDEFADGRFEYVVLLFYITGRSLRQLHTDRFKILPAEI